MKIGYARQGMGGQALETQLEALEHCDTVFTDKAADSDVSQPKLKACLAILNDGDILFVTRLDRLASSTRFLIDVADKLQRLGVDLVVLEQDIDTRQSTDRFYSLMTAIAQLGGETQVADSEAQASDKEARLTYNQIEEMQYRIACGGTVSELCDEYNISTETFYRLTE
jgi:DNA invertase Pin-like site-specific DNA recombinase